MQIIEKCGLSPRYRDMFVRSALILSLILACGCASNQSAIKAQFEATGSTNLVTSGKPNERLDRFERTIMAPRRWVRQLRGDQISEEKFVRSYPPDIAMAYLASNEISGINVDIDVYQPKLQWQRLREADHVGPIAKYTLGTLSLIRDAAMPARVFNQDRYNHFTQTLSLNSNNEASALYEAAMAKEHFESRIPAAATVFQRLPVGTTIARIRAGNDAIGFAKQQEDIELETELYPVVYSSVVSEALGDVGLFTDVTLNFPQRLAARIGARQIGKAVGSWQKSRRE